MHVVFLKATNPLFLYVIDQIPKEALQDPGSLQLFL